MCFCHKERSTKRQLRFPKILEEKVPRTFTPSNRFPSCREERRAGRRGGRSAGEEHDGEIRKSLEGKTSAPIPGTMPSRQLLQQATHQTSDNVTPGDLDPLALKGRPQTPSSHFQETSDRRAAPPQQISASPPGGDGEVGGEKGGVGGLGLRTVPPRSGIGNGVRPWRITPLPTTTHPSHDLRSPTQPRRSHGDEVSPGRGRASLPLGAGRRAHGQMPRRRSAENLGWETTGLGVPRSSH